jgi:anti-sigma factor RsiW
MCAGYVQESMSFLMRLWGGSCAETEARLSDHLDGDLSITEDRRVHRHLARCRRCQSVFDSLTRVVERLRSLGREDIEAAMPSIAETVATRIRRKHP